IELTRPPDDVRDFALSAPPRLVMDLHGPLPTKPAVLTRFPLTDDVIAGVRVATNGGALRIVADLNRPARSHAVRREGNRLVADLTDTGTAENPPAHLMLFAEFDDAPGAEPEFDGEAAPPPPAAAPPAAERPARVAASEAAPKAKTPPATAQPAAAEPPAAERAGTEAAAEPEPAPSLEPAPPLPVTLEPAPPPPAHLAALPHTLPAQAVRRESSFTGQRISLDFKDADIQNVLRVLADVSGLNIIATDDVKGKVTLHLNDVPWDQALDLVLRSNRLEKTQEGNVVRISTVSRLKEEREALRAAQDAEREPGRVELPRHGRRRRLGAERRLGAGGRQRRRALAGSLPVRLSGGERLQRLRGRKRVVPRRGARLARRGARARRPLDRPGAAGQG